MLKPRKLQLKANKNNMTPDDSENARSGKYICTLRKCYTYHVVGIRQNTSVTIKNSSTQSQKSTNTNVNKHGIGERNSAKSKVAGVTRDSTCLICYHWCRYQ